MLGLTFASGERPPDSSRARLVNTWRASTGEVVATLHADPQRRWIDWHGLAVFAFSDLSREVSVWPVDQVNPDLVHEVFRRAVLPAILQACGRQALHASAVILDGSLLVFCGRSGSGKSTLAYALGRQGLTQAADDVIVIDAVRPHVVGRPLPFSPRLRVPSREHFAFNAGDASVIDAGASAPVTAFFLLSQEPSSIAPSVERLDAAPAFSRLLAHGYCFDPSDPSETRQLTDDYMAMVAIVPVFETAYRPGLGELPALMNAVLRAARRASGARSPGAPGPALAEP